MSKTTIWCWRFIIKNSDDDCECRANVIPIDRYSPSIVDDMTAYYNWLYGEYSWWVDDTDLIEMEKREISIPVWIGFVENYGDGSCLDIKNWDWKLPNLSKSN
jgi:hypothetical protein